MIGQAGQHGVHPRKLCLQNVGGRHVGGRDGVGVVPDMRVDIQADHVEARVMQQVGRQGAHLSQAQNRNPLHTVAPRQQKRWRHSSKCV